MFKRLFCGLAVTCCVLAGPFSGRVIAQTVTSASADEKSTDQNWYPWLGERVKNSPASEREGYKPTEAGYVRLEVVPHDVPKAGYCGDKKHQDALVKAVNQAWNKYIKKETSWGVGVQIWYRSSDDAKPDVDRAPLSVTQFADPKNCAPNTDSSDFGSPLLPHPAGMAPVRAKIVSWRTKDVNAAKIKNVTEGISWAANLAGVPAAATNFALGAPVQSEILSQLKAEIRPGDKLSFSPNSVDPVIGGGRTVNIYLGVQPLSMATWKPGQSSDPRIEIRMVTVASVFDPDQATYRSFPDNTPYQLLQKTKWNGKAFADYLSTVSPGGADSLKLASTVPAFDSACDLFRAALNSNGALSDVDIEVTLYALGRSNPVLGSGPGGASVTEKMPIVTSTCLAQYPELLKKVGIALPDPFVPPELIAATPAEMRDAMLSFSSIGDSAPSEVPQGLADRLAEKMELLDPQQLVVKTGYRQILPTRATNVEFVRTNFGKAGCWLSLEAGYDPLLSNGFQPTAGAVTHSGALGRLEDGKPVFLVFEFPGHEKGEAVEIGRISIDERFDPPIRAAFKATYPTASCGAASAKPEIFQ